MPECQICKQNKAVVECPECGHQVCPDCFTENKCCHSSFAEDGRRVDDIVIFPPDTTNNIASPDSDPRSVDVFRVVKFVIGAGFLVIGFGGPAISSFIIYVFRVIAPTTISKETIIMAFAIFIVFTKISGSLLIFSSLRKPKNTIHHNASEVQI